MEILNNIASDLTTMRNKKPLVHNITNYVVMNETANAILCLGALPIMSHAAEEVEEMVGIANALVLNIGTLSPDWIDAMELAGKHANSKGIPVVLDPVGAGATRLRTESSKRLLENVKISIVRGNAAEVAALAGVDSEVRGVESIYVSEPVEYTARSIAETYDCVVAITGEVDVVCDGTKLAHISNGHPMLSSVVGTGCMATSVIGSFAAVEKDMFTAAVGGLIAFGIAGEIAARASGNRPGTFHMELYNALHAVTPEDIRSRGRLKIESKL